MTFSSCRSRRSSSALSGSEPWLGAVERVLLSSEPFAFQSDHVAAAQALCPTARVQRVDGELLSWYGARAVAGLRYLRALASKTGTTFSTPETTQQASAEIDRLRGLPQKHRK